MFFLGRKDELNFCENIHLPQFYSKRGRRTSFWTIRTEFTLHTVPYILNISRYLLCNININCCRAVSIGAEINFFELEL